MGKQASSGIVRIGARLSLARRNADMTIADVAAITKVSSRYLAAIEREEFDLIPSRVHTLGFTRAFAKAVNVDEGEVAEALRTQVRGRINLENSEILCETKPDSKRGLFSMMMRGVASFLPGHFNALVRRAVH